MQCYYSVKYIQYKDFYELKEIGSGSYRTVYTAKHAGEGIPDIVILKRFKDYDRTSELFVNEVNTI